MTQIMREREREREREEKEREREKEKLRERKRTRQRERGREKQSKRSRDSENEREIERMKIERLLLTCFQAQFSSQTINPLQNELHCIPHQIQNNTGINNGRRNPKGEYQNVTAVVDITQV